MGYGLRIRNVYGETVIDGNYTNYKLDGTGVIYPSGGLATVNIGSRINPPIVLVRPLSSVPFCLVDFTTSGGYYTGMRFYSAGSSALEWRTYSADGDVSAGGSHGMRVRNASGVTVFDSNLSYFKIKSIHHLSPPAYNGCTDIYHADTYPFYLLTPTGRLVVTGNPAPVPPRYLILAHILGMQYLSPNSVRIAWVNVFSYIGGPVSYNWSPTNTLLVCAP